MYDFDELWDKFNQKLLNHVKAKVCNAQDAEDILQDVFVKIFGGLESLENKAAIKPWIHRITKNTIIDFYKKDKSISVSPETLYSLEDEKHEAENMNDDIALCISNMIFALPTKYQTVYELHEKKDMKHKEIAEALDISVSASKVRLKRAKDMFKTKLVECCDFEVDKYGNIVDYHSRGKCYGCDGKCR